MVDRIIRRVVLVGCALSMLVGCGRQESPPPLEELNEERLRGWFSTSVGDSASAARLVLAKRFRARRECDIYLLRFPPPDQDGELEVVAVGTGNWVLDGEQTSAGRGVQITTTSGSPPLRPAGNTISLYWDGYQLWSGVVRSPSDVLVIVHDELALKYERAIARASREDGDVVGGSSG